jgi:hypothetical protein
MTTLRSRKHEREASTESSGDEDASDKENTSLAPSKSRTTKKPRTIHRGSSTTNLKERVATLLEEDTRRRAVFQERIEKLVEKSLDSAHASRNEFLSLLREQRS